MWRAYFYMERANYNQTEINLAHLCSMFANANFKGVNSKVFDYLPLYEKQAKQTREEVDSTLLSISEMVKAAKSRNRGK
jgi:hypothetical protein